MKYVIIFCFSCFLFIFNIKAQTFTFGIVPQQSANVLAGLWTPICNYLSKKTGYNIRFSTARDIPTFEQRLLKGEYDFAYMNPYHYVFFHEHSGYEAMAHQANKRIKGIIVVAKDSPITSLEQLNNLPLAFPSPAAFAASVLPRAKMQAEGIAFEPKYVSSHDSVYLNVKRGLFPAGGGIQRTLNNTSASVREGLRILWTTPGYTPHAIASKSGLPNEAVQAVKAALLNMHTDPEGKALLESIQFTAITAAENKDWDDIRALNIRLLD